MDKNTILFWTDCEMTGLDLSQDELIEVAIIPTNWELEPLNEGIDVIIKPSSRALACMSDFVKKMHEKSGLLDLLSDGIELEEAREILLDYIYGFAPKKKQGFLAGNSIWSDRKFLEAYIPELVEHLHYRLVDVSSLKELIRRWHPKVYQNKPQKEGLHRALEDAWDSIEELQYYREKFFI